MKTTYPFITVLQEYNLLPRTMLPYMKTYDVTTYPDDHKETYEALTESL